jgi:hypothetical protein
MSQEEQFTQLMRRPSLEEVSGRYQQVRQEISDKLAIAFGLPPWAEDDASGGGSLCGHEFSDLGADARTTSPPLLVVRAPIPDDQWDRAVRIVEDIARENGFGPPNRIVDRASQHTVDFRDKWGGLLGMDTGVHTVLSVSTGCHLTAEAKQRGTPTPRPEYDR